MKGIIYTRVSSDEQVDGTSLASQKELCQKYCDQKGIQVVAFFQEEGQSAKDLSLKNRARFLEALEFCRKAKDISAFVVFKVDRFARNTEDHFAVRRLLADYGTALHSVTEPIGDRPAEKFIETVLAGASEYDNAIRKQRCTDGMRARLGQGIWPFKPPIGYVCARHRRRGQKKTQADAVDSEIFGVIQQALRAYARGDIASQAALGRQLNAWGFEKLTGHPATTQLVDRLLGKYLAFYAGILRNPWTGEETPGLHEPMITEAERRRILDRKRGRKAARVRLRLYNEDFPLRRILKCPECARSLTGARSRGHGGTYAYYYCFNRGCGRRSKTLGATAVHSAFDQYMRAVVTDASHVDAVATKVVDVIQKRHGTISKANAQLENRLKVLRERRLRLFEMREDGSYDQPTFQQRLDAVESEIDHLSQDNNSRGSLEELSSEDVRDASEWLLTHLGSAWRTLHRANPSRFEKVAFPNGLFYRNDVAFRTSKLGLILALGSGSDSVSSCEVHLSELSSNQLCEYFEELIAFRREVEASIESGDISLCKNDAA